ncbi:MAG: signal transduction histidine kinase [Alphaproteobacteria bacterium]|jgi:signal transduction histidine kinase
MRAITDYTKSSSFVVSFFFIILLMVGVGFNTYTLTVANDDLLVRETQAAIQADLGGFRSLYNASGRAAVKQTIDGRVLNQANDFLYYYKDNKDIYLAGNLAQWPSDNIELIRNGVLDIQVTLGHDYSHQGNASVAAKERAMAMVIEFTNGDSLLVARSVQDIEFAVALAKASSWVMIIIVFVVAITSLGVAYYVVSRINKIADTADDIIATGNLSDRLYVESQWDDLSKLALVLNQLLDKIESSVRAITSVSDNIAHDLRTPLTRLKGHIEELKDSKERGRLIDECDNLLSIFNSLLRISDIENSNKIAGFSNVLLDEIVSDAVDLYSPLVEAKSIEMLFEADVITDFVGDKDLLFQSFANVLDNAIKFTPEGGKITVKLQHKGYRVIFSVDDSGMGVSKTNIVRLTQRFYREDNSRSTSGNGLGLSLVSAIVTLHGGKIWFEPSHINQSNGLRCAFSLVSA